MTMMRSLMNRTIRKRKKGRLTVVKEINNLSFTPLSLLILHLIMYPTWICASVDILSIPYRFPFCMLPSKMNVCVDFG